MNYFLYFTSLLVNYCLCSVKILYVSRFFNDTSDIED